MQMLDIVVVGNMAAGILWGTQKPKVIVPCVFECKQVLSCPSKILPVIVEILLHRPGCISADCHGYCSILSILQQQSQSAD